MEPYANAISYRTLSNINIHNRGNKRGIDVLNVVPCEIELSTLPVQVHLLEDSSKASRNLENAAKSLVLLELPGYYCSTSSSSSLESIK